MTGMGSLLEKHINKLASPLKDEEELLTILKKRLTKKEFKILMFLADETAEEIQLEKLNLDEKRYQEVKTKALKKVNYHELKTELCR